MWPVRCPPAIQHRLRTHAPSCHTRFDPSWGRGLPVRTPRRSPSCDVVACPPGPGPVPPSRGRDGPGPAALSPSAPHACHGGRCKVSVSVECPGRMPRYLCGHVASSICRPDLSRLASGRRRSICTSRPVRVARPPNNNRRSARPAPTGPPLLLFGRPARGAQPRVHGGAGPLPPISIYAYRSGPYVAHA